MSTAPGYRHQRSVMRLDRRIGVQMEEQGVAVALTAPIGLIMTGSDPVQPDFMLIRSERTDIIAEDERVRGVPDLIAEVLSPSHPELDTAIKLAAYARAGVPEYWIVRPDTRDVLVHTEPDAARSNYANVQHFDTGSILESPTLPIRVAVSDLFEMP
jgi:Uma2 family endonuclease